MHEQAKLNEAAYFYSRMLSETDNRENLLFDLSAFLSAAHSVLQYSLKEATTKPGGQRWYDGQITASRVLSFFKDKRDVNVHVQPIQVNQHTSIELTDVIRVSETVHIQKFDETGKLIGESFWNHLNSYHHEKFHQKSVINSLFRTWHGNEDVLQLCDSYLKELHRVVTDGQNKAFLTK